MKMNKVWKSALTICLVFVMVLVATPVVSPKMEKVKAAKNVIVALDPGHGGTDGGAGNTALGTVGAYSEANCNWKIAMACKAYLEQYEGITVYITRGQNESMQLSWRSDRAYAANANLFVSMHINGSTNPNANGCEVWHSVEEPYASNTLQLAKDVTSNLSMLGLKNNGVSIRRYSYNTADPMYNKDYYGMIRNTVAYGIPAILVEHAYVSSAYDARFLTNEASLVAMGQADAKAIAKYFALTPKAGANVIDYSDYTSMLYIADIPTKEDAPDTAKVAYSVFRNGAKWAKKESYDGKASGSTSALKQLESFKVRLGNDICSEYEDAGKTYGVEYQCYMESYGWMSKTMDGDISGLPGRDKRMEAIRINLTGDIAKDYDVYYRVYSDIYGWQGWAKNGATAGTIGLSKKLYAIQVKLIQKGSTPPSGTLGSYRKSTISYQTYVKSNKWIKSVRDGVTSGTLGKNKSVEGLKIKKLSDVSGSIVYRVHTKAGWKKWAKNGAVSGTVGKNQSVDGLQVYLTGSMKATYDVYYRVHVRGYGWLAWASNKEVAGIFKSGKKIEAVQIVLIEKESKAPINKSKYPSLVE